jgi:hypothetical protein
MPDFSVVTTTTIRSGIYDSKFPSPTVTTGRSDDDPFNNPTTTTSRSGPRLTVSTVDYKYFFKATAAPVEVSYSGYGYTWSETPRAGKTPLLLMESWALPKTSFTMQYADEMNPNFDCTPGLQQLAFMAGQMSPVLLKYGVYFESTRRWRITRFDFTSKRRHPTTDAITWAEINLEFTQANDVVLTTGPVSGGVKK